MLQLTVNSGATRILFFIELRSLCPEPEKLFLLEPNNPFGSEVELTDTSREFTERYLKSFRDPLPEDGTTVQLQDHMESGWLAWGKKLTVDRLAGWDEVTWTVDSASTESVQALSAIMGGEGWWQQVADYWAQEDQRTYPSATHIDFVLLAGEIYGVRIFESVRPIIDGYLAEMESSKVYDRHKMRSLWEFLAGLLRASEEWPGRDRKTFWDWLTPKLPELFHNIRHDTTK